MKLKELQNTISTPVFFIHQVQKIFSGEKQTQINISLSRMTNRGDLLRIKKGIFGLEETGITKQMKNRFRPFLWDENEVKKLDMFAKVINVD